MSDATTGTTTAATLNDHADAALAALGTLPQNHLRGNTAATIGVAQVHATLALAQEMAALRIAFGQAMADAFAAPQYSTENQTRRGGAVVEALRQMPGAMH